MRDQADVIADNWYSEAFEELQAQGHLHQASGQAFGGDAHHVSQPTAECT
jgi:hypothetical protein